MSNDILNKALEQKEYMSKIFRHIHQYPEIAMQEFETTKLIKKELKDMGVEIVELKSKIGVLGIIRGTMKGGNRVTALRADIDALPVTEKTNLPYASKKDGLMHACGHDAHTTMLLGTAKILSAMRDKFSGIVKLIFQPGEETLLGAKYMVRKGVLENPQVDTILAFHVWPLVEVGKIGILSGNYHASADKFTIKVIGKGRHGAYPHKSLDAVLAAAQVTVALQSILSREIDAFENVVISICTIHGGKAFNVVPEEVIISGTVRCQQTKLRSIIKGKMERITKGVAEAYGCRYKLNYEYGVPSLTNDLEVVKFVEEAAEQVLGKDHVDTLPGPVMSSEDFSIYLGKVHHGAFVRVGITKPNQKPVIMHNDHFYVEQEALPIGVAVEVQFVLNRNQ